MCGFHTLMQKIEIEIFDCKKLIAVVFWGFFIFLFLWTIFFWASWFLTELHVQRFDYYANRKRYMESKRKVISNLSEYAEYLIQVNFTTWRFLLSQSFWYILTEGIRVTWECSKELGATLVVISTSSEILMLTMYLR